jgi:microcystin-dependent protein
MPQVTDYIVVGAPSNMAAIVADIEAMFAAAISQNRGATAPDNPVEGMLWWDTSGGATAEVLKRYTVAGGWVSLMTVNITAGTIVGLSALLDEDDMASDSAVLPPSQQSVKAYVDNKANSNVGDIRFSLSATPNSNEIKLNGGTLNRAEYPELWAWADNNSLTIADASWAANCGLFSQGDGSTNFKVPDFRAMFPRIIDDSRGVDTGRTHGSYQADDYKQHAHTFVTSSEGGTGGVITRSSTGGGATNTTTMPASGGTETRGKNITVYAFIRFE